MPKTKAVKKVPMFKKEMYIELTGKSKQDLQDVAHAIHAMGHPLTLGGKGVRAVTVDHTSTAPHKVLRVVK